MRFSDPEKIQPKRIYAVILLSFLFIFAPVTSARWRIRHRRASPSKAALARSAKKKALAQASAIRPNPSPPSSPAPSPSLMSDWMSGRFRGANVSMDASLQDLKDLADLGANFVRVLLPDDAVSDDPPYEIKPSALLRTDQFLNAARIAGLKVVLGIRDTAGRHSVADLRIWKLPEFHLALEKQWKTLAGRYRSDSTLAGFDLLSEPNPEALFDGEHPENEMKGTMADWNLLARRLTSAVREIDPNRPLIVETPAWAYARGFAWLEPTGDPKTVYSFHMFSPHRYTHQEPDEALRYPGSIPAYVEPERYWDAQALEANLLPAFAFQSRYKVPICVGEFGTRRIAPDGARYLSDLLALFERSHWSWSFWAFRDGEDWNPELGPDPSSASAQSPADSPSLRVYRDYLSLNAHPLDMKDLPLLSDADWVEPMREVHAKFSGIPGTVGLLGDSITYGTEFFTPLFSGDYVGDPKSMADLRRFRETVPAYVGGWKDSPHGNHGGWHVTNGLPGLPAVLKRDNPEIALVMFGTNDLNDGMPGYRHFEENLRRYLSLLMRNGTVPILSSIPPKRNVMMRVKAYNDVICKVAGDLKIPMIDFNGAILRRRPSDWIMRRRQDDWYRTLIIGDGVHPSFPDPYQRDFREEAGLLQSGFTLRNYLAMEAVLAALDRLREPAYAARAEPSAKPDASATAPTVFSTTIPNPATAPESEKKPETDAATGTTTGK